MMPDFCAIMCLAAAWLTRNAPLRPMFTVVSHAASGSASSFPGTIFIALFTTMSMRPRSMMIVSTSRWMSADLATSATTGRLLLPSAAASLAVASAVAGSTSFTTTWAPSRAYASTISRPMPRPPPVTSATLSFNLTRFPHKLFEINRKNHAKAVGRTRQAHGGPRKWRLRMPSLLSRESIRRPKPPFTGQHGRAQT